MHWLAAQSSRHFCSSVAKGAKFETLVTDVLRCFGFHLHKKGGAGDLGNDLQGLWQVGSRNDCLEALAAPSEAYSPMVNVIVQCKHEKKPCKPAYVRELDGVLSRWTESSKNDSTGYFIPPQLSDNKAIKSSTHKNVPILGLLVCSSGFTPSCITALQYSNNPMLFMKIDPNFTNETTPSKSWYQSRLKFVKMNRASQRILPKLRIGDTFVAGSMFENTHPSIVLFNDQKDISNHELVDY